MLKMSCMFMDEVLIKQLGTLLPMLETLIPEDMTIDIPILTKNGCCTR